LAKEKNTDKVEIKAPSTLGDIVMFTKLRLASLVVFSAFITYLTAVYFYSRNYDPTIVLDWAKVGWLSLGGFLVTAGSNGFNQIIEKDLDKLMARTCNRPLPTGRMTLRTAWFISLFCGISGTLILWFLLNPLTGVLGLASLISYSVIYTPLKQKSSWAVFVGAFPGAAPPLIGWVAFEASSGFTGSWVISPVALSLFCLQFMWQFPHFWAIAWRCHDDYKKAGFHLLPSSEGKDLKSAFQILLYTIFMIPISLLPCHPDFNIGGITAAIIMLVSGGIMLYPAFMLFKTLSDKWASKLMFASFIYLPLVLLGLLYDQLF
tara:strand:+ start:1897 stop:2853 length:957 start_codon:yes stop_codon:yes gene_type:complete